MVTLVLCNCLNQPKSKPNDKSFVTIEFFLIEKATNGNISKNIALYSVWAQGL